jgi:hypothetical protein
MRSIHVKEGENEEPRRAEQLLFSLFFFQYINGIRRFVRAGFAAAGAAPWRRRPSNTRKRANKR